MIGFPGESLEQIHETLEFAEVEQRFTAACRKLDRGNPARSHT